MFTKLWKCNSSLRIRVNVGVVVWSVMNLASDGPSQVREKRVGVDKEMQNFDTRVEFLLLYMEIPPLIRIEEIHVGEVKKWRRRCGK